MSNIQLSNNPNSTANSQPSISPWRFCLAPMMEWSDRHCRYFWRLLSQHARLYTEMVTTPALIRGDRERFLAFNKEEHPVALQLGGSNPAELAECAKMAEDAGYDEVNLNCGCPSDRVQNNKIGACLMAEPHLVAECFAAMQQAVRIPVTIKNRIGIDDQDDEADLHHFTQTISEAGCQVFIVHARKAWLKGLSPKENREIPPLNYDRVKHLKSAFPELTIVLNGGLTTLAHCEHELDSLDGVMMGREAYHNPFILSEVDKQFFYEVEKQLFNAPVHAVTRESVLGQFIDYCWREHNDGTRFHHLCRHILGIYAGQHGGKIFRRYLSENACRSDATPEVLEKALEGMITLTNQHQERSPN